MNPVEPELLLAHGAFLRRLARGMLGDEHEAEDVVQEAYAAALRAPAAGRVSLGAWLYGTAANLARRARRSRSRRLRRERVVARPEGSGAPADETVERLELQQRVVRAVLGLAEPGRTTVVMRYYDGLGPTEIARRFGCPVRTVESRLRRAHEELRAGLDTSYGSRRAWAVGLLSFGAPLCGPGGVGAAAIVGGALVMKKVAAVLALLLLAGGFVALRWMRSPVGADRASAVSQAPPRSKEPDGLAGAPARAKAPQGTAAPEPLGGASILGTVTRGGKPARARVEVRPLDDALLSRGSLLRRIFATGAAIATAESGVEGRFRIDGLPVGSYQVVARAADGAVAWGRAFCRAREPSAHVSLELAGGTASIDAVARHADGRPFRGLVSIRQEGGPGAERWFPEVETDADGRFHAEGLPAGACVLAFVLPDRWRSSFAVEVPLESGRVFVVDEGLVPLAATIVADDTGEPVADARAFVGSGGRGAGRGHDSVQVSDGKGAIRVEAAGTELSFWVEKEGFETVQTQVEAKEPIVLRMPRQGTITGRVVEAGGVVPVPGVTVHGWNWYTFAMKSPLATSDADGRFTAQAGPGKGMVYALGGGWVTPALSEMTDASVNRTLVEVGQGGRTDVLLEVVRAGRVEGALFDAAGGAVPGVLVSLEHPTGWAGFSQLLLHGEASSAVTSAEGRYAIENLIPSFPYVVVALPPGGAPARSEVLSARSGETIRADLRLPSLRGLSVRVRERGTGRAVEGAEVSASQSGRHGVAGKTGPDGTARLEPLLPEPLWLSVRHPDYLPPSGDPASARLRVPEPAPDAETYEVELVRGAFVAGRVVQADGATPRATGHLGVFPVGARRGNDFGLTGLAVLGSGGAFRLGPVPAGTYDLILVDGDESWDSWNQVSRWTVETGRDDLVLRVDPARTEKVEDQVAVRVVASDGRPVRGFLRVFARDRVLESMVPIADGRCVCREVLPGTTAWVEVRGASVGDLALAGFATGPLRLEKGTNEIRLPAPRSVEGRVVGPDGSPVVGLLVYAAPTLEPDLTAYDGTFAMPSARTDEKGTFRLPAGDVPLQLIVEVPAKFALQGVPPVAAGATDLLLTLAPGRDFEIPVVDPEGRPIGGASVQAVLPGGAGMARKATADVHGAALLPGLGLETAYRLTVTPPSERGDLVEVVEGSWHPTARRIVLAHGDAVRGAVRTPTGVVPHAAVWWREDGAEWHLATAGTDGAFSITARAGTEVVLRAARPRSTNAESAGPPVRAAAGARDVVLRVPD